LARSDFVREVTPSSKRALSNRRHGPLPAGSARKKIEKTDGMRAFLGSNFSSDFDDFLLILDYF
jgi:hypothetical protein